MTTHNSRFLLATELQYAVAASDRKLKELYKVVDDASSRSDIAGLWSSRAEIIGELRQQVEKAIAGGLIPNGNKFPTFSGESGLRFTSTGSVLQFRINLRTQLETDRAVLNDIVSPDPSQPGPPTRHARTPKISQPREIRTQSQAQNRFVFLVHGHDGASKHHVARVIEKLGLEPIILHEQPNKGQTIIEKFETHSSPAFAVVLLTPDDMGHAAGEPEQPRARQNVILELGYFMGKLGRDKVMALVKGGVELPSDYSGVVYVELDDGGAWATRLGQELRAAGIDVDLNRLAGG